MSQNQTWQPAGNPWLVAITVTLAVFMACRIAEKSSTHEISHGLSAHHV